MRIADFEARLDRWGADLAFWPAAEAAAARRLLVRSGDAQRALERLAHVESLIAASRPEISVGQAERVVRRALAGIERREANPPWFERLGRLLLAPVPRAAMAMSLAAIGFAIGLAVTAPASNARFDTGGAPLMPASADDVLF